MEEEKIPDDVSKPAILIGILIGVLFLAALMPTIVDFIQGTSNIDTTTWNFTGSSGAASLWLLIPLIVIAGAVLGFVKDLI